MTDSEARKLWTDHPNPVAADAERALYLAGAQALERAFRDICKAVGLPQVASDRPQEQEHP